MIELNWDVVERGKRNAVAIAGLLVGGGYALFALGTLTNPESIYDPTVAYGIDNGLEPTTTALIALILGKLMALVGFCFIVPVSFGRWIGLGLALVLPTAYTLLRVIETFGVTLEPVLLQLTMMGWFALLLWVLAFGLDQWLKYTIQQDAIAGELVPASV